MEGGGDGEEGGGEGECKGRLGGRTMSVGWSGLGRAWPSLPWPHLESRAGSCMARRVSPTAASTVYQVITHSMQSCCMEVS